LKTAVTGAARWALRTRGFADSSSLSSAATDPDPIDPSKRAKVVERTNIGQRTRPGKPTNRIESSSSVATSVSSEIPRKVGGR
jgi:hypothetical protein